MVSFGTEQIIAYSRDREPLDIQTYQILSKNIFLLDHDVPKNENFRWLTNCGEKCFKFVRIFEKCL